MNVFTKKRFLVLPAIIICFLILTGQKFPENNEDAKWDTDPRTSIGLYPSGNYSELPQTDNNWVQKQTEPRIIESSSGTTIISPNYRVHPRSAPANQSEVILARHPTNPLIMYGSANTFQGGNFSTGYYVTTNGGDSWYGNDTMTTSSGVPVFNFGDPGPVIDKDGRFLISYITLGGSMGASYSTNNGLNFSNTNTFPGAGSTSDKNLSGTDVVPTSPFYGRSYTVYTEFGGPYSNRIVMSWTSDGGVSWSNVSPVSPPPSPGHMHQGCDVNVGPNGEVYVVWANCIMNGQNSTEDSLGFAVSLDGGSSWVSSRSNASNMNGIRGFSFFQGLRMAGFPRLAVDRTGGVRNGWIYVTSVEKKIAPATDTADITLHKSTDGGVTWTSTRVNQDTPGNGKFQLQSAINVDDKGGVNIVYYDTRNTPTNDSSQIYISRSEDGGNTWNDILVSDHKFLQSQIPGTATGYQGDYIGISSAYGVLFPFWAENTTGSYNAWTASVRVSSYPLNSFNKTTPAAGVTIQTLPNNSTVYNFNWDTAASSATYKWIFGSPSTSPRMLTIPLHGNIWSITSGELDNLLAGIGLNQGDSLVGQWDVWAFRNNASNDSLLSSNGPRAITLKRTSPSLIPFQLFSPLNNVTIQTLSTNTNPNYFKWRRSGTAVTYKLFYAIPNFTSQSNIKFNYLANNNGFDTVLTLRNSELDSAVTNAGIAYGDSAVGQWRVYAYNGVDSLGSNIAFNLKLRRGTAPAITTSLDSIAVDLPINQTITRPLSIGNTGQNPLYWSIVETLFSDIINSGNIKTDLNLTDNSIVAQTHQFDGNTLGWVDENPSSGTVNANSNQAISIIFNSNGLTPNTSYTGELNIQSNDPSIPVKIVKVRLNVGPLGTGNNAGIEIPIDFELKQNFPNPFNPSTKIKFALPNEGFTVLKIYNSLGKEVVTLVNENKPAGFYEMEFNASSLASGLYFYKLESADFKETKRMLLIK
jgi:hypothetical protein